MTEAQIKSLIRHALTALGAVITIFGVGKLTGVFEYLNSNFDTIWGAASTVVGAVLTLLGFFRNPERFQK